MFSALRGLCPSSLVAFLYNWSSARACLGSVVMGTTVAGILGGFAAVYFPLDVVSEMSIKPVD